MSWDELRTRALQEAGKRFDLSRYRLGLGPGTEGVGSRGTSHGKFFFSSEELPRLTKIIKDRLPRVADEILAEADELCRHRFRLLGYSDLNYGLNIDWHRDAVSNKRAPLDPWFKIPFLDFDRVGDHKVIWELNRHQHLVIMAKAWALTGDERYANEVAAQWASWELANPYPLGINWASSLEVAFRSLSWLWIRELLADCDSVPARFGRQLLDGLALSGRHIERYLSTYFSPNTHLIGEAAALFFIGTLCGEISAARQWKERGWRILLAEAARQVRMDGGYFEQSLYYHVYALDFFLHARQLAVCNGIDVPAGFDQTLVRMLGVLQTLSRAGIAEGFGDDDGGRVFNPRRNRVEHMHDPLVLGAGIFGGFTAPGLTEEAIWLLGVDEVTGAPTCPDSRLEGKAFDASGIYVMDCPGSPSQCLMVDGGPQGTGRSGHGHADALSVRLVLGGRRRLIDSGSFTYREGTERDLFRGTAAHNTLRVDGQDQAVPDGPFAWSSIPTVTARRWVEGATFTLFTGSHDGYERLNDPVRHRRFVIHLRGGTDAQQGLWLVRDVVEGQETHDLEIFWHFAPDLAVTKQAEGFVVQPSDRSGDSGTPGAGLHLFAASASGWAHELSSAYVSPVYGLKEESQVLRSSARVKLPSECVTLLVPTTATSIDGKFESISPGEAKTPVVSAYRYTDSEGTRCFFFSDSKIEWECGSWSSDAKFLYCFADGQRLSHLALHEGTFVGLGGRPIVKHKRTVARFEYLQQGAIRETFASDNSALESFAEESLVFV